MESMTLTLKEVKENLTTVDFSKLPKPGRNKGDLSLIHIDAADE